MRISVDIPNYDGNSLDVIWDQKAKFGLKAYDNCITLSANKEAMISFAKQLLYFAHNEIPNGSHIHFDSFFCKGLIGEYELVIEMDD